MFKNWKSTMAFLIFISAYVFTLVRGYDDGVVEVTGYVALYSSIFMMFRSNFTQEIVGKLVDNITFNK